MGALALAATATLLVSGCAAGDPAPETSLGPGPLPSSTESASPGTETEAPPSDLEVVLVFASMDLDGAHASVSGYINGVIEDGGSCRFEMVSADKTVRTVESTGAADRASTSCGVGQFPTTELSSGSWQATLTYQPVDKKLKPVTSAPETVEVP